MSGLLPTQSTTQTLGFASGNQQQAATQALTSDFQTFLLMLTTQLQNQDPLNPIESQDFAVQLATFSGVEQQVRTNQLLESLSGGLGAQGLSQLAGWVGMEARVAAPVAFDGSPVEIAVSPDPGSDAAELIVTDGFGREVWRAPIPIGQETYLWAGTGANGGPLPSGDYELSLASRNRGEVTSLRPVQHYSRIVEARQGLEGIDLVIAGGQRVAAGSVTALRAPAGG
jgi:flagellar basal-body rod modification protein FlgD